MNNTIDSTATAKKKLQWHQAFYAGIQFEFEEESDKLIFENEHHIGTQPKRIDVLVIKKVKISIEDITITLISHSYPRTLIKHLKDVHHYDVQQIENGIYYIEGDFFPIQLLVTKDLTDNQNLWLHNLTNDIQNSSVIDTLISEYEKNHKNPHYKSIMDIIVHSNIDAFKEVTVVCKVLEDLYWEVHGERIMREQKEALDKAVAEIVSKTVAEAVSKAVAEAIAEKDAYIKQLEAQLGIASA